MITKITTKGYLLLKETSNNSQSILMSGKLAFFVKLLAFWTPRIRRKIFYCNKESMLINAIELQSILSFAYAKLFLHKLAMKTISKFFSFLEYSGLRFFLPGTLTRRAITATTAAAACFR